MFISVDSIIGELFEILFLALLMQGKIRRAALYNWNHPLNIILKDFFFFHCYVHYVYFDISQFTQTKLHIEVVT